ncbi:MAG: cadmium-translocating P-type ATPase [Chloroflexi bacterium]|nr:MAG: cadmium-translocating P-type ATPase [Chloroflexota bacterium]
MTTVAPEGHEHALEWPDLLRIGVVAVGAAAVWLRLWEPLPHVSVIGVLTALVGGWPIFRQAFENVVERRMTMELSMTIALVAALVIGEFFTALVITLFVLVAEVLEGMTVARGRRAISNLLDLLPRTVTVRRNGTVRQTPAAEVRPGDLVLVQPGARIPVDGPVVGGRSFVDQSPITGESMPVEKTPGTPVYAGTINQSGALEIRAERLGRDTSFGKIVDAVERAERSRAPIQKIADRLAGNLVYFALACAALTFLVTRDARSTISVVIVAGACALAILGAIGRAARQGAVVKGGLYLESLAKVDTVVLDKTGTLTLGRPEVTEVLPADGTTGPGLLEAAAIAERRSEHPLGKAIVERASAFGLAATEPEDFEYTPGRGVVASLGGERIVAGNLALFRDRGLSAAGQASGNGGPASEVLVARGGRFLGSIRIADAIRPEAKEAVGRLHAMGIRTVLLTGDSRGIADAVGRELGIEEVGAELLPEDKVSRVKALVAEGRRVAMLGDGINDAPALMEAHVGVAMGSGTDVARESADVVLLGNDLLKFADTVQLARQMRRIILQNFAGTLAVDGVGVGLAAFGLLNPPLAAFIHVASELTFILNSTRLLPPRTAHAGNAQPSRS